MWREIMWLAAGIHESFTLGEGLIARNPKHPFPKDRHIHSLRTKKGLLRILGFSLNITVKLMFISFYKG